jgi:hypothetical protein
MSTTPDSTTPPSSVPPPAAASPAAEKPKAPASIKLISHSTLFYWWPVWAAAFFMALWTFIENNRLAIVPNHTEVTTSETGNKVYSFKLADKSTPTNSIQTAVRNSGTSEPTFRTRVSEQSWLGPVFVIILILTIVITNVPLRGLWSFITIILVIVLALFISLLKLWDSLFETFAYLHIYINMAGYLTIGVAVFILWAMATFFFDRRSYVIFAPGQIQVCEHIGASIMAFPSMNVAMEKQRDDLFRHYILGFGSGDLILKLSSGDRREIRLPNVFGIGWRMKAIEKLLVSVNTNPG